MRVYGKKRGIRTACMGKCQDYLTRLKIAEVTEANMETTMEIGKNVLNFPDRVRSILDEG